MRGIVFPNPSYDIGLSFPERDSSSLSGTAAGKLLPNQPSQKRDELILDHIQQGNTPSFLQSFKEIEITSGQNTLKFWVSPDYLSIGDDSDFLRITLGGKAARTAAELLGCMLPTSTISDYIFHMSDLKLNPETMTPNGTMVLTSALIGHNDKIQKQIAGRSYTLIDGIKKDIIIHSGLLTYKKNICIYGWRYPNGKCIQCPPQYKAHVVDYQDYSQGVRLVARKMLLNQVAVDGYDLLKDPLHHRLINSEPHGYDASSIYL